MLGYILIKKGEGESASVGRIGGVFYSPSS